MKDLKRRTLNGLLWSTVEQWTYHGLNALSFVVFARILTPEHFGTWGIAVIYMNFVSLPISFGLRDAVIHRENPSPEGLSSVFYTQALVCLGVVLATLALAPFFATLLHIQDLTLVLQATCVIIASDTLGQLQEALFQKNLNFKVGAIRRFLGMVAGSIIGITAALMGAGIWSLVLFHTSASVTRFAVVWMSSDWRPRGKMDWSEARPYYQYGIRLFASSFVFRLKQQSDSMLVGLLLGHVALGYYTFALRICAILHELVSAVLAQIVMPLFSLLRDDLPRARRAYLKLARAGTLIALPAFLGALATAPLFIPLFFGPEWLPVVPIFQFIALAGAAQTLGYNGLIIVNAFGKPELQLKMIALNCLIAAPMLFIGAAHSLLAAAAMYCLASWLYWILNENMMRKLLAYSTKDLRSNILYPSIAAFSMVAILCLAWNLLNPPVTWSSLVAFVLAGGAIHVSLALAGNRKYIVNEFHSAREQLAGGPTHD